MKTTGFLKKDYFKLEFLAKLFNRSQNENKSQSLEELKQEIATDDYREKVKFLIKEDLLLKYHSETVEQGLKDFDFRIKAENVPQLDMLQEEEPVVQDLPTSPIKRHEILTEEKKEEVWKVQNRIPKWFKNPHQINSRILIAYMDLLEENKSIPVDKLEAACRSIKTFQTNFSQMKIIAERNHAKVFEEVGNRITLWEPVREFVKKEYKQYNMRRGKNSNT